MPATTAADLARFDRYDSAGIAACVVRASELAAGGGLSSEPGFEECPIVGPANPPEAMPAGRMSWPHGFHVRALRAAPGARSALHARLEEEVLLQHAGQLTVEWDGGSIELGPGDVLTIPKGLARRLVNRSAMQAVAYVVRGGDRPQAARQAAPAGSPPREARPGGSA